MIHKNLLKVPFTTAYERKLRMCRGKAGKIFDHRLHGRRYPFVFVVEKLPPKLRLKFRHRKPYQPPAF